MLPGSWGRGGHGKGPWIWGLGERALMGESLWSPSPGKGPRPSQVLQVGERKGYPIWDPCLEPQEERVKEVHLFSGSEGIEPPDVGKKGH